MSETSHEGAAIGGVGTLPVIGGYGIHLLLGSTAELSAGLERTLRDLDPHATCDDRKISFRGAVASTIEVGHSHPMSDPNPALSQTWDWPGAEHALNHAASAVFVRECEGPIIGDRFERLRRFNIAVRALMEHLPVVALHWDPSQRLVEPAAFVHRLAHGSSVTDHAVNVRLFRVPDGDDEAIMDTFGMAPFGLPDLQVHFSGMDPESVSNWLLHYSDYIFDKGDVLDDEHLVRGVDAHEEWLCRRQLSIAPPFRPVIDFYPADHAADH